MTKFFIALAFVTHLFCASISLTNDSQFHLTAVIYNAAGQQEGSIKLNPGQTHMWYGGNYYDPFKEQLNQPYAPYQVTWICNEHGSSNTDNSKNKKNSKSVFGTWNNVSVGSTVTSMGSPIGTKSCSVSKKKNTADQTNKKSKPNPKDAQNDGFNNFSNDGGQTWTNDGGTSPTFDDDNE